jgi:Flp pilus assembly pilin Flp
VTYVNIALTRVRLAVSDLKVRLTEERGQDLLEYALLGGLLAAALVTGFALFAGDITVMTDAIADCIDFDNSVGSGCGF